MRNALVPDNIKSEIIHANTYVDVKVISQYRKMPRSDVAGRRRNEEKRKQRRITATEERKENA